ncbi:hypothetical protein MLD38_021556 [Melastoma candidum]|uniref:Uncharacterized protein n=1 Tax=Melastoma candidum TaxID=119954 RepID=A0ACB9QJV1_9MYRT|nr:hypothetical protein MLD38_021556 [Melastoma candidum]
MKKDEQPVVIVHEDCYKEDAEVRSHRRRCCLVVIGVSLLLLLLFFVVVLALALTVFRRRDPEIQLLSATLDGISPQITFPALQVQLNVTLNLVLLLKNRNHVTFRHGSGQSVLIYRGRQVGEAEMPPGTVPAMKSTTVNSKLVLQMEKMAADMGNVVSDVLAGKIVMSSNTTIPGRITVLKIIRKHVVTTSECQFVIGIPSMKIQSQDCSYQTKL